MRSTGYIDRLGDSFIRAADLMRLRLQTNRAIIGKNSFLHVSGISISGYFKTALGQGGGRGPRRHSGDGFGEARRAQSAVGVACDVTDLHQVREEVDAGAAFGRLAVSAKSRLP